MHLTMGCQNISLFELHVLVCVALYLLSVQAFKVVTWSSFELYTLTLYTYCTVLGVKWPIICPMHKSILR